MPHHPQNSEPNNGSPKDLELLSYLEGELEGADLRAVETALAASPELREELERLQATRGLYVTAFTEAASPPDDLLHHGQ